MGAKSEITDTMTHQNAIAGNKRLIDSPCHVTCTSDNNILVVIFASDVSS